MDDEKGTVKLVSKEGVIYEVPLSVAKMSALVAATIDDDVDDDDDDD